MSAMDRLRTIPQAGEDLGLSRWTVRRLVKKGLLSTVMLNGRERIRDTEIERFRQSLPRGDQQSGDNPQDPPRTQQ